MSDRNVVFFEIPAKDRKAAADFYKGLFGWETEHYGDPMNYSMFQAGGVSGGFPDLSDQSHAGDVRVYIGSSDIEADLKKAESLGGKIVMPKTEIPGFGWYGMFTDPTGNTLALWTDAPRAS